MLFKTDVPVTNSALAAELVDMMGGANDEDEIQCWAAFFSNAEITGDWRDLFEEILQHPERFSPTISQAVTERYTDVADPFVSNPAMDDTSLGLVNI